MRIDDFSSIDQIGPDQISRLEGSKLDFSYGLLRAIERSLWGGLTVRYVCVTDGNDIIAFTPVYIGTNLNFNALMPGFIQRSYTAMVDNLGLGAAYSVAVVGCLISDRGWIPARPGSDMQAVLNLMLPKIDSVAREHGAKFILVKDIHHEFQHSHKFVESGYVQVFSLPTIQVATAFKSFDGYLASLTKNGRKHARKTYRKAEGVLALQQVTDFAEWIPSVYPLFRNTFLKAKYQFEELSPRFFEECANSTTPKTKMILCLKGSQIVGALLMFYDSREQLSKRIGIDYRQEDTPLIYNLLMYEGLRHAVECGIEKVHLGQSTYVPKTRMGGQLDDQYLFLKAFSTDLRISMPLQRAWLNRYRSDRVLKNLQEESIQ
ncbi:MAG TPA: GNAT family N-acetyltransferase [Candidatus Angelobacter sp.]|nr:GNAT family N-acetyltransferase [Candidatus Angelobacter sp.]